MRTISFRTLTTGIAALLAFAGTAAAQSRPSALLNTFEVRQLVDRGEPADNARLSMHFSALAERYTEEATRHEAMSRALSGNPNRREVAASSTHCSRLAELNMRSAATVGELAAYHELLAAGIVSMPPADSSRFYNGEGAPEPTEAELDALAANARTPADHRALEEYFLTLAKKYTAEADAHVAMAHAFRGTRIATAATHCDRVIKRSRDSAKEANETAARHRNFADIGY